MAPLLSRVRERAKGLGIAVYVPAHFALASGHVRSSLARRSVDAAGRPTPWYTFPAIDFLATLPLADVRVLEFGAGHSTLWWAERAASVLAVEEDPEWLAYVERRLGGRENVECLLRTDLVEHSEAPRGRSFDVVVIDGGDRLRCARTAVEVVEEDGLVLLDNSEGYWGPPPSYPIIDLFREQGFARVDFYGYCPGVRRKHCTSLFFRGGPRLLRELPPPVRPYRR